MSWSVNRNAILMARAAGSGSNVPVAERYFVPQAVTDLFDVRKAGDSWRTGVGAAEMSLQRYLLPLNITGYGMPGSFTVWPGSPQMVTISFDIENLLDDPITFGHILPADLSPYGNVVYGTPSVSTPGDSDSVTIASGDTETLSVSGTFSAPSGGSGKIDRFTFPGSLFTLNGDPWVAPVTFTVNWNSVEV